jgi:cyclohexyl-isocyanide hydratase
MAIEIGFLVFPKLQQLDLTGPNEVFAALPGTRVHLIWKTLAPVIALSGLSVVPTVTMQDRPWLDMVSVCGGAERGARIRDKKLCDVRRLIPDKNSGLSSCGTHHQKISDFRRDAGRSDTISY